MCWARFKQQIIPPAPTVQDAPARPQDAPGSTIPPAVVEPPAPAPAPPAAGIYPDLAQRISPNAGAAFASPPDMLVIHFTASGTATSALGMFNDTTPGQRVSAHFLVDRDGWTCQCVRTTRQAWHAGESGWKDRPLLGSMNVCSIGIEQVNWGRLTGGPGAWLAWTKTPVADADVTRIGAAGWQSWPSAQRLATLALCRRLCADLPIKWVLGHDEIAPTRKNDPGPAYPLNSLRRELGFAAIGTRA